MPSLLFGLPFAALVLAIAIFPLLPHKYAAWWDNNRNKLIVSVALSLIVLAYYFLRSTGFAEHGASVHAVQLMRQHLPSAIQLKASGGIRTAAFARELLNAGATRLGCSASVAIVNEQTAESTY